MSKQSSRARRPLGTACAAALLGAALIACPAGEQNQQDGMAADTTRPEPGMDRSMPAAGADSAAEAVQVVLTEFDLQVHGAVAPAQPGDPEQQGQMKPQGAPADTIPAGEITFQIRNAGSMEHSFEIEGADLEQTLSDNLARGETDSLTVELAPGAYHIYCPIANHQARGMTMNLVVTPSSVTALRSSEPGSR